MKLNKDKEEVEEIKRKEKENQIKSNQVVKGNGSRKEGI